MARDRDRFKPLLFVIYTLALWWAIATAAFVTATCIPEGRPCPIKGPWQVSVAAAAPTSALQTIGEAPAASPAPGQNTPPGQSAQTLRRWRDYLPMPSKRDSLVFVSLIAALFVAKAIVFPYDDLSKPAR